MPECVGAPDPGGCGAPSAARISGRVPKTRSPAKVGCVSTTRLPFAFTTTTRPPVALSYRRAIAATGATGAPSDSMSSESDASETASCSTSACRSLRSFRA